MSSIYLPDQIKTRLMQAAKRRGYVVQRGRQSQLAGYLAYLITLDEQAGLADPVKKTFDQALGLLAIPGHNPPSDAMIDEILAERRMQLCTSEPNGTAPDL